MRRVVILAMLGLAGCQPAFQQADVDKVTAEVRANLGGKGFTVDEVQFVKETPTKLKGFARFHRDVALVGRINGAWRCEATMASNEARYIWSCAP